MSDETQSRTMECPDCGGTVSKRAANCPHCGAPIAADEANASSTSDAASTNNSDDQTAVAPVAQSEAQLDPAPAIEETTASELEPLEMGTVTFTMEHLTEGETIVHAARFHPAPIWALNYTIVTLIITYAVVAFALGQRKDLPIMIFSFSCLAFVIWLVLGSYLSNVVYKTEFVLTDKRIIAKWGFLRTVIHEIPLEKIESINYGQTIIERWLWYGIGRLTVTGTGGGKIKTFRFLLGALEFRKRILNQIDKVSE